MLLRAAILMAVVIVVPVYLKIGGFRLFLVAFRRWPLGFLIAIVVDGLVLPLMSLSFGRMAPI